MKISRTGISPYQATNFQEKEKAALAEYESSNIEGKILITNTLTDVSSIDTQNLKLIIHPNSGYDNFPLEFVQKADFPIVIGNEIRAQAVSEYILFCLFNRFGNFSHQTIWERKLKDRFLLKEKNILLIGYGHIGTFVKRSLECLAGNIYVVDPYVKSCSKSLDEVPLEKCDIVILCASLNPTSYQIINKEVLDKLPKDFTLINPSRGDLVSQSDLIDFLEKHPNSFAYLDVFDKEPCDLSSYGLKNLFTTSHIAGVFENLDDKIIDFEKKVLNDFLTNFSNFSNIYKNSLLKNRIKDNFLV